MVSIIVPVYDAGSGLTECLQSVASQTYTGFECILVDDGSTDGSGDVCDRFAESDERFKAVHQANGGVSAARNRGLREASGDFIAFIDSDDIAAPGYVGAMLEAMEASGADLAVGGMSILNPDGSAARSVPEPLGAFALDNDSEDSFVALEGSNLLFGPVSKLYRRSLIEEAGLRFDESKDYGEDLLFNLAYLDSAHCVVVVPEALYTYRRAADTLSTRFRPDMFENDYGQWKKLSAFHAEKGLTGKTAGDYLYRRLWGIVYDSLFLFPRIPDASADYLRKVLSIPEIDALGAHQDVFDCPAWIKRWVLRRRSSLFALYFKLLHRR